MHRSLFIDVTIFIDGANNLRSNIVINLILGIGIGVGLSALCLYLVYTGYKLGRRKELEK